MRSAKTRIEDATFELSLAPMLDMMVVLIPALLLYAVFVKVSILDAPIPQPVAQAIQQNQNDDKRSLQVYLMSDRSVKFVLFDLQGKHEKVVPASTAKYDFVAIHNEAISVKQKHSDLFRLELFPADEIKYDEIVKVMDELRDLRNADPKISMADKASGKPVALNLMFPDIVFGNVLGGK
ncbi:MAG: hypothetical protein COT74_06590 [Bdellovibrionales bacterium CG10_big_fil_rev_8_21_14_0_10_45_34]|nr:MAG: hypothetical protein COT74_06590 [Bdellovibrionales bacterium CG10_big_fil_rev_8_21_14_0_10_45_34]